MFLDFQCLATVLISTVLQIRDSVTYHSCYSVFGTQKFADYLSITDQASFLSARTRIPNNSQKPCEQKQLSSTVSSERFEWNNKKIDDGWDRKVGEVCTNADRLLHDRDPQWHRWVTLASIVSEGSEGNN